MFDGIEKLYNSLKGDLLVPLDEYLKSAESFLRGKIKEDAFFNRVLKEVKKEFPLYFACIRPSGDMDTEIAIFNVPQQEYKEVYDKAREIIHSLDTSDDFYIGVHVVSIENTRECYPKYLNLRND